ncbi:MAG: hypothetical protein ABSG43_21095 [Solirubrobacteraceae bacterium]|jgi:hypothetical protein
MIVATQTRAPLPTALVIRDSAEDSAALWAMTPAQRIEAMWAGRLTLSQLTEWSGRRPDEVPTLGGELAYIVMRTPEWDEPRVTRDTNVVQLPQRRRNDRAAA